MLDKKKIKYKSHFYGDTDAVSGADVADVLAEDPACVFKTLVTSGKSGSHYVFVIPVTKELDLKKAAKSVSEKSVEMVKSKELLGLTGYIHGGCSPIGMKKFFRTVVDISAERHDYIYVSAGKIGYQIEISLDNLRKMIRLETAELTV